MSKTHTIELADRALAKELLAYAITQLFSGAKIIKTQSLPYGFSCQAVYFCPFDKGAMMQIGEKLSYLSKKMPEVELIEMMPQNAAQYFDYHGQPFLAESAKMISSTTTQLIEIGSWRGFYSKEEKVGSPGFCQLLEFKKEEMVINDKQVEVVTIVGANFLTKPELKQFVKKWQRYQECQFDLIGKQMGLIWQKRLWLPKGVVIQEKILNLVKNWYQQAGFLEVFSQEGSVVDYVIENPTQQLFEINKSNKIFDNSYLVVSSDQIASKINSFLLFIRKISNMFAIELKWELVTGCYELKKALDEAEIPYSIGEKGKESKVIAHYLNPIGDSCNGAQITVKPMQNKRWLLQCSTLGSLEGFVSVLTEQCCGDLPMWLAAEHVRLLPIKQEYADYCNAIAKILTERGFFVQVEWSKEPLAARVWAAKSEKVPYVVCVGKQEVDNQSLSVDSDRFKIKKQMFSLKSFEKELEKAYEDSKKMINHPCLSGF